MAGGDAKWMGLRRRLGSMDEGAGGGEVGRRQRGGREGIHLLARGAGTHGDTSRTLQALRRYRKGGAPEVGEGAVEGVPGALPKVSRDGMDEPCRRIR